MKSFTIKGILKACAIMPGLPIEILLPHVFLAINYLLVCAEQNDHLKSPRSMSFFFKDVFILYM